MRRDPACLGASAIDLGMAETCVQHRGTRPAATAAPVQIAAPSEQSYLWLLVLGGVHCSELCLVCFQEKHEVTSPSHILQKKKKRRSL